MKRLLFFFPLALTISLSAQDDWSLNNHYFLNGEFVYLRRTDLHGHNIVSDSDKRQCLAACPNFQRLNTKKLVQDDFWFEPGYRLGFTWMPNADYSLEINGFQIGEWTAHKTVHGNKSLSFPFDNPNFAQDYNQASVANAYYSSGLWGAEANYWRHVTPRRVNYFSFSWLAGLRYLDLIEGFKLSFFKPPDKSHYRVHTKNQIGIVQLGADLQMNPTRSLNWEFLTQAGIGLDWGKNRVFLGDVNDTVTIYNYEKNELNCTYFINAAASVGYQFSSHHNLHAGYEFMYLSGVVLAPEQLEKSSSESKKKFVSSGEAIFHGLFVGITFGF